MHDPFAGSYVPLDTPIHRAAPFVKLCAFLALVLLASLGGLPGQCLVLLAVLIAASSAKLTFRELLGTLKEILPFLLTVLFMNGLFFPGEHVLWKGWIFCVSAEGLRRGFSILIVMAELVMLSAVLRRTTTPLELTDAVVKLLRPLKFLGVDVNEIGLLLSLSIQFIPVLQEESRVILRAQQARGAAVGKGRLRERARAVLPMVVPIFLSAFRRAEELSQAMEARGYFDKK